MTQALMTLTLLVFLPLMPAQGQQTQSPGREINEPLPDKDLSTDKGLAVHKFPVQETSQILSHCQESGERQSSKIQIHRQPDLDQQIEGNIFRRIKFKFKICTGPKNLQKGWASLYLPDALLNRSDLQQWPTSQKRTFSDIPSTTAPGKVISIQITKSSQKSIELFGNPVDVLPFQLVWKENEQNPYPPMTIMVAMTPEQLPDHLNNSHFLPWVQISSQIETWLIDIPILGTLEEVQWEK